MTFWDSFSSALRAIRANKLRSALTMLGVVIGVGSVIAMVGIGEGTKKKSLQELEIMGSNRISVVPNWRRGRGHSATANQSTLRLEDVEAIKREVPLVKNITGIVRRGATVKFGANNHRTNANGAHPSIQEIENAKKMHSGEWYTYEDEELMNKKAVLGWLVYEELFGGTQNALGAIIKINNQNFEVVGVVDYKGGSGWMNPDDQVYVPLKTAQYRLTGQKDRFSYITMQATSSELLPIVQSDVEAVLGKTRKSATGEELFRVFNQAESLEAIQTQSKLLSYLLAGIASVSLLVGGIGIMNIMLVSVTERTKEIGLRKALGATGSSILSQFLLESIVMCIMGGLIGIILGGAATRFVANMFKVPPVINSSAVMLAFGFATIVGLFFGIYPAVRASRLQPIDALRYE
jgi:putative ABC transport system permease protein